MADQFSAQDPALGYFYQIRYALWLLLEAGKDSQEIEIAIEKLDDIDIKKDNDKLRLAVCRRERNKSHASLSASACVVDGTGRSTRKERGRGQNRDGDGAQ